MKTLDGRDRVVARHQRRFAESFDDAAPARIGRVIDHRREGPALAMRIAFESGDARHGARVVGIEGGREPERHRKHGPVAVDDVGGEHHRDAEPGFLDGDALDAIESLADHSKADIWKPMPSRASSSADLLGRPAESGPVIVPLLSSMSWLIFSCERHARQQRGIARIRGRRRVRRAGQRQHTHERQHDGCDYHAKDCCRHGWLRRIKRCTSRVQFQRAKNFTTRTTNKSAGAYSRPAARHTANVRLRRRWQMPIVREWQIHP